MVRTAVLVSGGGTNLQAIIAAKLFGEIGNCEIVSVISSNPEAYALSRAQHAGIPTSVIDVNSFPTRRTWGTALLQKLKDMDIQFVVLSGFTYVLEKPIVREFENRIINVHPALIPSFCGEGCYGLKVHKMALNYGVRVTGATVHFVTDEVDAGPIILQKAIEIQPDDTPRTLQQRVMEKCEWEILPRAMDLFCRGKLTLDGRIVHIEEEPAAEEASAEGAPE